MNTAILKKVSLKPLTLLAVLPLALTGCVSTATDSSSSNSEVKLVKPGTLSVCTNTPYKPFEYEDNGTIVGLDADIANAIASDLGVKAQLTSSASRAWTPAPAYPPVSAISPWQVSA